MTPLPALVSGTRPRPDHVIPSSEVATVFPPDPTATNLGLLNVVMGVNPIPKPLVVNVVVPPRPVHTMPSGLVAYVLPPCPMAVQIDPFQPNFGRQGVLTPRISTPLNDYPSKGKEMVDFCDEIGWPLLPWQQWLAEHAQILSGSIVWPSDGLAIAIDSQNLGLSGSIGTSGIPDHSK